MQANYEEIIDRNADQVLDIMQKRSSAEEMRLLHEAFELAREAHAPQKRKTGEPYILHPIAVALIVAKELQLDTDTVAAAFLHDVVEDTAYTLRDIRDRFGEDVAFLVNVVTKEKKDHYDLSKQLDNYKQILDSMRYDIRAVLIKLADRLHNMRTLASMRLEKQMKIAGETDYFYAPLANRLGLYNIKTELENLSFRFRCPDEFDTIATLMRKHIDANKNNLDKFKAQIEDAILESGIKAIVRVDYRRPFSLWRKMHKYGDDFNHLKYRHFIEVVYDDNQSKLSEKEMAMKIYCVLTNRFKEKHGGMSNYIDSPKENGYQSIHVKLLPDFGRWQEVHISSRRMIRQSQLGCVAERTEVNLQRWIEKFRKVLFEIIKTSNRGDRYMEDVVSSFYNDDIMVFTPNGDPVIMPQKATVIDYAYEVHTGLGDHAKYARINGWLEPVTTTLRRGDVVEIFTDPETHPDKGWIPYVHTYKAKKALRRYLESQPGSPYCLCKECNPIPGEEIIGIQNHYDRQQITLHRRDCNQAITLASSYGDDVVAVDFRADDTLYPVTLSIRAVDRHHLLIDLVECIANKLKLSLETLHTVTEHAIVTCRMSFGVHSYDELKTIINHVSQIEGVDEVKRLRE